MLIGSLDFTVPSYAEAPQAKEVKTLLKKVDALSGQGKYEEAVAIAGRALALAERTLGRDHPQAMRSLNRLALLYYEQGHYDQAEPLFRRALAERERVFGREHPDTLTAVNDLAAISQALGRNDEAETLYKRALNARDRTLGSDHPDTLKSANGLAVLYQIAGRYDEAEPLYQRVLKAFERTLGSTHPDTLTTVSNLATFYDELGRYDEAEPLYKRVLAARERTLGRDHADTVLMVDSLAALQQKLGRYDEAETLYERALDTYERTLGHYDPQTLLSTSNLASLYEFKGRYNDAEPLFKRALEGSERTFGPEHAQTLERVSNLANLYVLEARFTDAEPLHKRALEARERTLGRDHSNTLSSVNNLGLLYESEGRYDEAMQLYERGLEARARTFGGDSPDTVVSLNNLAALQAKLGRYDQAEPLLKRALEITERVLGREHPDTLLQVTNLAALYGIQGRSDEANTLYSRAQEGFKRTVGEDHPLALANLGNFGVSYFNQSDWSHAAQLWRRGTAALIQRTQRGSYDVGRAQAGKRASETERSSWQFSDLVKALYRLNGPDKDPDPATVRETFRTGQWALSSEAARSLALMAARVVPGDPKLAAVVREKQDLATEWQGRDALRNAALGAPAGKRDVKAEAENLARLAAIDQRILQIDKLLAAQFPDYAALANPEPLAVQDVQAQLAPDEVLVTFLDTIEEKPAPEETFIWVLTKTDMRWLRSDLGRTALTENVEALRCGLDEEEWATPTKAARCADMLGLTEAPDPSRPLPFDLGKANTLYQSLFGKAEDLIRGKRMIIVPSGALTSLPFHVLVTQKPDVALPTSFEGYRDVPWLARANAIVTLPAVSSLAALRRHAAASRSASPNYAGYGDPRLDGNGASCRLPRVPETCPAIELPGEGADARPDGSAAIGTGRATVRGIGGGGRSARATMDDVFAKGAGADAVVEQVRSLCPLPDTAYEIKCVADSFKAKDRLIRLEGEATEADLKALSASGKLAGYGVLHFATHGLLSGDVERMAKRQGEPALVLTPPHKPVSAGDDGLLMASEVASLKLNADWVVLSACNTAAGDKVGGEALSGLARAFFYAGARAMLVSHWPVYSDAAVRLTTRAFAELENNPKAGRAEALQRAMTALMDDRSQDDNAHPSVWAPFVVVGDGER